MSARYDVVIVGAGLVGLTLGKALTEIGNSVAIIDNRPELDPKQDPPLFEQRAIVLSETSCEILEKLGIKSLLDSAAEIKTVHVSERGSFGKLRFRASDSDYPRLARVVKAFQLLHALERICRDASGLTFYRPAEVTALDTVGNSLTLRREDATSQIQAQLIIAADGAKSFIVDTLGLSRERKQYEQVAVIANLAITGSHRDTGIERFLPEGPLAFLPTAENEVAMVWCTSPSHAEALLSMGESEFLSSIQEAYGYRFGRFVSTSPRHQHPLVSNFIDSPLKQGVLVMGNAAHSLHPVAGQGFNLSVRDIRAFVEHVIVQKGFTRLEEYVGKRVAAQQAMSTVSDLLPRVFLERYRPLKKFRSLALTALDRVSPLNRLLLERFMGARDEVPAFFQEFVR